MLKAFRQCVFSIPRLVKTNVYCRSNERANQDLYELLGVNKNADSKQLKKAYYKLAQQYHPDKNPSPQAKQKFTKINNAYEILSDGQKRQTYDQTGNTGEGNAAGYNQSYDNVNFQDIFKNFSGFKQQQQSGGGGFQNLFKDMFGGFSQNGQSQRQQNEPSVMNISVSFDESVKGCVKVLEYEKKTTCSSCKGSKCQQGTEPQTCRTCSGSGKQTIRQGMFIMQSQCGACEGEGKKIKHYCSSCSGSGLQKKKVKEQVNIPRGINDGMTIQLNNKGNFNNDLYLKVSVKKSSTFIREGINVATQIQISVLDAILGAQKDIKTIQGTMKKVKIPEGFQPGQKITLKNEGFYMVNSQNRGDHILNVKIQIPKTLTVQERTFYEKLKQLK